MPDDAYWMKRALELARTAAAQGEVPVGAVVVSGGAEIGSGFNQRVANCDPTAHAEIVALRNACARQGDWRLTKSTLYVTLEPCMMCFAASAESRVRRICFGALDPKRGVVVSIPLGTQGVPAAGLLEVTAGVLADECAQLLLEFFQRKRET